MTLGKTPFGPIGVRMAKTIGVTDGGGRILNSAGQRNEAEAFRKPARWVDYSGPITNEQTAGITLMDHPANPEPSHAVPRARRRLDGRLPDARRPGHDRAGQARASALRAVDSSRRAGWSRNSDQQWQTFACRRTGLDDDDTPEGIGHDATTDP